MLIKVLRMTSAERKASGRVILRTAESSRVRSNHWAACVCAAFWRMFIMYTGELINEYLPVASR